MKKLRVVTVFLFVLFCTLASVSAYQSNSASTEGSGTFTWSGYAVYWERGEGWALQGDYARTGMSMNGGYKQAFAQRGDAGTWSPVRLPADTGYFEVRDYTGYGSTSAIRYQIYYNTINDMPHK